MLSDSRSGGSLSRSKCSAKSVSPLRASLLPIQVGIFILSLLLLVNHCNLKTCSMTGRKKGRQEPMTPRKGSSSPSTPNTASSLVGFFKSARTVSMIRKVVITQTLDVSSQHIARPMSEANVLPYSHTEDSTQGNFPVTRHL